MRAVGGYTDNFDSVSALFDDSNPEVKAAVVEMLGLHTSEKGARRLIKEALPNEDERIRAAAMTAYRAHAKDRAEETLVYRDDGRYITAGSKSCSRCDAKDKVCIRHSLLATTSDDS